MTQTVRLSFSVSKSWQRFPWRPLCRVGMGDPAVAAVLQAQVAVSPGRSRGATGRVSRKRTWNGWLVCEGEENLLCTLRFYSWLRNEADIRQMNRRKTCTFTSCFFVYTIALERKLKTQRSPWAQKLISLNIQQILKCGNMTTHRSGVWGSELWARDQ